MHNRTVIVYEHSNKYNQIIVTCKIMITVIGGLHKKRLLPTA